MSNNDYPGLVTSQHQKPRYTALVAVLTQPLVDAQALLASMPAEFDVDTAVGVQLDAVGLWAGITRVLRVPLSGVYFAWGIEGVGWSEGVWKGPYDPTSGLTSLPDDVFRRLIKARIAANAWDGSIPGAYSVWESAFADTGSIILIQDNQAMSMVVGIAGQPLDTIEQALLVNGYIPLKPEGVQVLYYAVAPSVGPLFAWDVSPSSVLSGWDSGQWPTELIPA